MESFKEVLIMVENGYSINAAVTKLGISRATFYNKITEEQKRLLKEAKVANSTGKNSWWERYKIEEI